MYNFERGAKEKDRDEGVTGGSTRDTEGEGGTGVTPGTSQPKEGPVRGRLRQPSCSWLVPCEALCFLSFPSERLCFTCKQWQWPQLAWPSAASKLAGPRKEGGGSRIKWDGV